MVVVFGVVRKGLVGAGMPMMLRSGVEDYEDYKCFDSYVIRDHTCLL